MATTSNDTWCSSVIDYDNLTFFYGLYRSEKNSVLFKKTVDELDWFRQNKPEYFYDQILYRHILIDGYPQGWITPFFLVIQHAPLPTVRYVMDCRIPDRPIASDHPTALHIVCAHTVNDFHNHKDFELFNILIYEYDQDVNKKDSFGRSCGFYARSPNLLNVLVGLNASLDSFCCAEFAVETDNDSLLNVCQLSTDMIPHLLSKAVDMGNMTVLDTLLRDESGEQHLRHRAHVLLAVHYRLIDCLFVKHSTLARQTGDTFPPDDKDKVDDFCDQFYAKHYDLDQQFNYHLDMVKRYRSLGDRARYIRRAKLFLEFALSYPEAVISLGDLCQPSVNISELAKEMPLDYTERLVTTYPRFKFESPLLFLFQWMAVLQDSNLPSYKTLLSQAVTFRGPRQETFLHHYPKGNYLKLILDAKADVDALNADNDTPLVLYSNMGLWHCARELLKRGAHPDLRKVNIENIRKHLGNDIVEKVFPLKCLAAKIVRIKYPKKAVFNEQLQIFVSIH